MIIQKNIWSENLKGRHNLRDLEADGRIIFTWILRKKSGIVLFRLIWLRTGTGGALL
jgi:hypothetical protein